MPARSRQAVFRMQPSSESSPQRFDGHSGKVWKFFIIPISPPLKKSQQGIRKYTLSGKAGNIYKTHQTVWIPCQFFRGCNRWVRFMWQKSVGKKSQRRAVWTWFSSAKPAKFNSFFCATRQFLVEMKHELFVISLFGMLNTNNWFKRIHFCKLPNGVVDVYIWIPTPIVKSFGFCRIFRNDPIFESSIAIIIPALWNRHVGWWNRHVEPRWKGC